MVTGALSRLLNNACTNVASDPSRRNIDQERGLQEGSNRLEERRRRNSIAVFLMDDNNAQFP